MNLDDTIPPALPPIRRQLSNQDPFDGTHDTWGSEVIKQFESQTQDTGTARPKPSFYQPRHPSGNLIPSHQWRQSIVDRKPKPQPRPYRPHHRHRRRKDPSDTLGAHSVEFRNYDKGVE